MALAKIWKKGPRRCFQAMTEWNMCPVIGHDVNDKFCDYFMIKTHPNFQFFFWNSLWSVHMETLSQNVNSAFF